MHLTNDIVLRPRFKFILEHPNEIILKDFEDQKKRQSSFIISRVDDHVFIRFPKTQQHFWSPQLHLEINEDTNGKSVLHGLFGPNPTIWTLFMFLHFVVAGLFIAFAIWAYTNYTLKQDYSLQLFGLLMMVVLWFALYAAGRLGRAKGKPEMHKLYEFMNVVIASYR
ncbi:MAG: GTP-binding protein [Winogradskyella sp.]|nr:GTP-binding protein [Winogradskyella sp.]